MAEKQITRTITVEQKKEILRWDGTAPVWRVWYIVKKAVNTTDPKIYDELNKEQVDNLIQNGFVVNIV